MKKSLLSILAGALVVVGCQNYDDQFDQLESQINALASTVAGLSQVQSDLSALAQTVANLQAGVSEAVDAALANSLSDIEAAVAQLEEATEGAASPEDVQAIADAVADQEDDLAQILANSSVQNGDVTITSVSELDAWYALKGTLTIINGNVTITTNDEMDKDKLQEILDVMVTVTKDFSYTSDDTDFTAAFPKLAGTRSLTIDMEGNVVFPTLTNATVVSIDEDSSTTIVDLGALENVTSLSNGDGAGTFRFSKATNVHLTSLEAYDGDLTIEVDSGGTILLDALRDVDEDGDPTGDDLRIEGPESFTISELDGTGANLTFKDVLNVTVNGYNGTIILGEDVENFSADNVVSLTVSATDLVSVDITGALDSDDDEDDKLGPVIDLDGHGDLDSVDIDGLTEEIRIDNNGNLTSVIIAGTVQTSDGIFIDTNSDLNSIDVSGATTDKLVVSNNGDLERLTVDFTAAASIDSDGTASTQEGTIDIDSNESLEFLKISTNNIDNLSITDNSDLEEINLTGMDAIGATGTPDLNITGNDLEASEADKEDEDFTEEAGMSTAKEYIDAVAAAGDDASGEVHFDMVDSVLDTDGDEESTDTADFVVWKSGTAAVTEGAVEATVEKRSFILDLSETKGYKLLVDDIQVFQDGSNYGAVTMTDNQIIDKGVLLTNLATTRATDLGFTLDVVKGGKYTLPAVTFLNSVSSVSNGEHYSNTAAYNLTTKTSYLTTYDEFTITVGGKSARASVAATTASSAASVIADALALAWGKKWASDGASANFSFWTTGTQTDSNAVIEAFTLRSSNSGSRAADDIVEIAWEKATAAQVSIVSSGARTESVIDWTIGATEASTDNGTSSDDLILSLTEVTDGVISSGNATLIADGVTTTAILNEITTTLNVGAGTDTDTTNTIYPTDGRGDAVANEAADEGVVTSPAVAATDRTSWLD